MARKLDRTTSCLSLIETSEPFSKDSKFECEIAYAKCLRAKISEQIIKKTNDKLFNRLIKQTANHRTLVNVQRLKYLKMQNEIQELKNTSHAIDLLNELEASTEAINKIIIENNVEQNLDEMIGFLEDLTKQIALKDVKAFSTKEECDSFVVLLTKSLDVAKKMQASACYVENMADLAARLQQFEGLMKDVKTKSNALSEIQDDTTYEILKGLSDKFAASGEY